MFLLFQFPNKGKWLNIQTMKSKCSISTTDYSVFEERLIALLNNTIAQVGQGQIDSGELWAVPAGPSEGGQCQKGLLKLNTGSSNHPAELGRSMMEQAGHQPRPGRGTPSHQCPLGCEC